MSADHRKPLDGALLFTSYVILTIVLFPAFIPRPVKVLAFVVVGWCFHRIIFTQTTGNFNIDFALGTAILVQYMLVLDIALLTPPENLKDFHDNDPTRVVERPLKKRVLWAFKLFSNPRGIGWAHEPSHLPHRPSPSTPRSRFVISRILYATCCFCIAGGASIFDATYAGMITAELLTGAPLHRRVVGVLSFGLAALCMISGNHAVLAASVVGCGVSSPEKWPLLFGPPLQVWSIKSFWRRFWHQLIRRSVLSCTSSFLDCVFPANSAGTTGYKFARLYIVFCLSGLAHTGGDVMATGKLGFKSFTFFMLQPFGITLEFVVSYLWHRLRSKEIILEKSVANEKNVQQIQQKHHNCRSLTEDSIPPLWIRCLGRIWVALWMVWTAAYMVDALYAARLSANPGHVSIYW